MMKKIKTLCLCIVFTVALMLLTSISANVVAGRLAFSSFLPQSLAILFALAYMLLVVLGLLFVFKKRGVISLSVKGLSLKNALATVGLGFVAKLVITGIGIFVMQLENGTAVNQDSIQEVSQLVSPLILIPLLTILAPIVEEVIFRGFVSYYLRDFKTPTVLLVSSLLFGLAHTPTNWGSLIIYAGLGLILGLIYHKTKRLEYSILFHFLNNALSVLVLYLIM